MENEGHNNQITFKFENIMDSNPKGKRSADEENAAENQSVTTTKKANRRLSKASKTKALGSTIGILHDRIDRFFQPETPAAVETKQSGLPPTDEEVYSRVTSTASAVSTSTVSSVQLIYYFVVK